MELKEIYWDRSVREAVWKKGHIKPDYSPNTLRWDDQGRIMMWSKFGRTDSIFGWTIAIRQPLENGVSTDLDNLYPVSTFNPKERD